MGVRPRLVELVDAGGEPGDRGQGGRPVRADLVVTRSLPVPARSCASSRICLSETAKYN